jgi:predicted O-methyltransferase YrrM
MLARGGGARNIVEFGISTLHLAAALRDNGGGRLVTSSRRRKWRVPAKTWAPAV